MGSYFNESIVFRPRGYKNEFYVKHINREGTVNGCYKYLPLSLTTSSNFFALVASFTAIVCHLIQTGIILYLSSRVQFPGRCIRRKMNAKSSVFLFLFLFLPFLLYQSLKEHFSPVTGFAENFTLQSHLFRKVMSVSQNF